MDFISCLHPYSTFRTHFLTAITTYAFLKFATDSANGPFYAKYQKEYAKSTKNLIESAYFTMKGDALISQAKRSGETSAVSRLKQTLSSNKISGSKQTINNGSAVPLWSLASQQLLRKPQ